MSKTKSGIVIADISVGDIFSESAHYQVTSVDKTNVKFKHIESGEGVQLSHKYVQDILETADQYSEEKTVNKEDSSLGPGIRSIFENIGVEAFTVCFTKQGSAKTQKAIAAEKAAVLADVDKIVKSKKAGVSGQLAALVAKVLDNPIVEEVPGEDRVLRGYKVQHTSRDGKYNCADMDITSGTNIRPVNINTIKWLVVGGVKYTLK